MIIVSQDKENITDEMKFNIKYNITKAFKLKADEYLKKHKELEELSDTKFKTEIIKAIGSEGLICSIETPLCSEMVSFGEYSYERAKEVLGEIKERYCSWENLKVGQPDGICSPVYEMPQE